MAWYFRTYCVHACVLSPTQNRVSAHHFNPDCIFRLKYSNYMQIVPWKADGKRQRKVLAITFIYPRVCILEDSLRCIYLLLDSKLCPYTRDKSLAIPLITQTKFAFDHFSGLGSRTFSANGNFPQKSAGNFPSICSQSVNCRLLIGGGQFVRAAVVFSDLQKWRVARAWLASG